MFLDKGIGARQRLIADLQPVAEINVLFLVRSTAGCELVCNVNILHFINVRIYPRVIVLTLQPVVSGR